MNVIRSATSASFVARDPVGAVTSTCAVYSLTMIQGVNDPIVILLYPEASPPSVLEPCWVVVGAAGVVQFSLCSNALTIHPFGLERPTLDLTIASTAEIVQPEGRSIGIQIFAPLTSGRRTGEFPIVVGNHSEAAPAVVNVPTNVGTIVRRRVFVVG